uniref:Uncharacterized protein n=1 Tax=Coccolithus braarudii TaxID=221442 RepID=A0A7S0Q044_9EUKA|mmetsp:Transcript_27790/g.59830  ORF Transcript_27790/g.59830 Transcript_27790/m.59830 type:complete len:244 (+) Transcript_27790:72-803(+)|eukprot:CAMPEP_0183336850 /NCGR_PEP_ID=MMETSP0164_2-20130417/4703_1 /TAXON_ID=221442 /ORGANISM="Coccolithus pelagicus ssp braarudi, Strain PLY182g" /LENGTH=243 /DNA_ID=CAMNT_0025506453 /DNA_START=72 /DNA_END=803 /DNA_ORIENTATION=+
MAAAGSPGNHLHVEAAIEGLNKAIERVNVLEDEKEKATRAANRAEELVNAELQALDERNQLVLAVREARDEAGVTMEQAQCDGRSFTNTLDEVKMAQEALRELRRKQKSRELIEVETHLRKALSDSAARASKARKQAKTSREAANMAAIRLGKRVDKLLRAGGSIDAYLGQVQEYEEHRRGLMQVREDNAERLRELELGKEEATDGVGSAMHCLENLSEAIRADDEEAAAERIGSQEQSCMLQ